MGLVVVAAAASDDGAEKGKGRIGRDLQSFSLEEGEGEGEGEEEEDEEEKQGAAGWQ